MERESKKKTLQLKKLQEMFKRVPSRARQEALDVIGQAREGKFAQRVRQVKEAAKEVIRDESSGLVLGG